MDFQSVAIGGVGLLTIIFGTVEALKKFGVKDQGSQVAAMILGLFFFGINAAIERGAIPGEWVPIIEVGFQSLGGALAAMGLYDFVTKRILAR